MNLLGMAGRRGRLAALMGALVLWLLLVNPAKAHDNRLQIGAGVLVVSPGGPFMTIEAALAEARAGDVIEVHGGAYAGPLVVNQSVRLEGRDRPVIDGGGQGTVVTLAAPDIVFRGFEVRGSGSEPDRDHAGIQVVAPSALVEDNRLRDVLFGIFVAEADGATVRGNDISSKPEYDTGRQGDAIRVWYSQAVTVEGNHVADARDVVVWYSNDVVLRHNVIERSRYSIHLMYCDRAVIEGNRLEGNSVGVYNMYSKEVTIHQNLIRGQRGPSGYALGFKDVDRAQVVGNVLVDNGAGAFIDGMPYTPQGFGLFEHNIFAFNDVGIMMQPAVSGNRFIHNTFWENVAQVAVQGGGLLAENQWQGNYWSDYAGYDADGDGRGDVPYRAERFFEGLADREPRLRMLLYSPAAQAIEFAGQAFPVVRPQPKLVDPAPRLEPLPVPAMAGVPAAAPNRAAGMLVVLPGLGLLGCAAYAAARKRTPLETGKNRVEMIPYLSPSPTAIIRIHQVSKRYGRVEALRQVSINCQCGQALALWGQNGAGKTTLLKAILGLIDFQGDIHVAGHDARRAGKLARRSIGYVPQEATFYNWSVWATMEFFAHLKSNQKEARAVLMQRIPALLAQLGLAEHATRPVNALSGGLKQRLALAIALLADPPVLLLDEPTANLDAQARRDYLDLLAGLRDQGKTILFATHRLEELEILADQVLLLEQGQLVEVVSPQALRARLAPAVAMTLWVPEAQRADALSLLQDQGWASHLNGRGTVIVVVATAQKMQPLETLRAGGIPVLNFEVEQAQRWN